MDARWILLACVVLLAVGQSAGAPCTVCDGNGGEDVCSCAQQVIRPPIVLPPRHKPKKLKTLGSKCGCQKDHAELPRVYVPKASCSCQHHQQGYHEHYEPSYQHYDKYPQNYDKYPQTYDSYPQTYDKYPQNYDTYPETYNKYPQKYNKYPQNYDRFPQYHEQGYQPDDDSSETSYSSGPSYQIDNDDDDDGDSNQGHHVYKRSLGGYGGQGQQRPEDDDERVTYYPVGGSGRVGVDATSRMLARQLEKKRGKSVKEDGLIFGPRTVPVDGEVKPTESDVDEGGLQEYDKEVLELKSSSTGFSEEDEYAGDIVDTKRLVTYSQIGYRPSDARTPEFLRRLPVPPQRLPARSPFPGLQYPPRSAEPHDGYTDEFPHHHQHFQRFIKRVQEAHKSAKKPYFGEKKYY